MALSDEAVLTDILVVGGGPVGLAAAALLSQQGYRSIVLERRPNFETHPRGHVISSRTMEVFEQIGCADAVHAMNGKMGGNAGFMWAQSLAGQQYCRLRVLDSPEEIAASVAGGKHTTCSLEQGFVEKAIGDAAAKHGADIRFGHKVLQVDNTANGVQANVEGPQGRFTINAQFCIACDGAGSTIRKQHGVEMRGPTSMMTMANICFKADLQPVGGQNNILVSVCNNSEVGGGGDKFPPLVINYGTRKYCIHVPFVAEQGEALSDFNDDRCRKIVGAFIGTDEVPFEILGLSSWNMAAQTAERWRIGDHIFLAGDAAHRFPPTGGFGLNSGVHDVHNLAWKLDAVMKGWAPAGILDSYYAERPPVVQAFSDFSWGNALRFMEIAKVVNGSSGFSDDQRATMSEMIYEERPHFFHQGLAMGFRYVRGALVPDLNGTYKDVGQKQTALRGAAAGGLEGATRSAGLKCDADLERHRGAMPPDAMRYTPTTLPGARCPFVHLRMLSSGEMTDPHRLLHGGTRFLLLAGKGAASWSDAATKAAKEIGIPLLALVLEKDVQMTGVQCLPKPPGKGTPPLDIASAPRSIPVKHPASLVKPLSSARIAVELPARLLAPRLLERIRSSSDRIWQQTFELPPDGALLVRPDGHVAWRSDALRSSNATAMPSRLSHEERLQRVRHALAVATGQGGEGALPPRSRL